MCRIVLSDIQIYKLYKRLRLKDFTFFIVFYHNLFLLKICRYARSSMFKIVLLRDKNVHNLGLGLGPT